MDNETIRIAEQEAKRFIERVRDLRKVQQESREHPWSNPVQSGAVRRASMDLTRALAVMRRP